MSEIRRKSKYIEAGSFMEKEHVITDEPLIDRIAELQAQVDRLNRETLNGLQIYTDGDSWCATQNDFINPQESVAGYGDTPQEAIDDLQAAIKGDG